MGKRPPAKKVDEPEEAWVEAACHRLTAESALLVSDAAPRSLSRVGQQRFSEALARRGFERTARFFRVPLEKQAATLLEKERLVPLKELSKHLRGATAAEIGALAKAMVRAGTALIALRDGREHLAHSESKVVTTDRLRVLKRLHEQLGKTLRAATPRKGKATPALLEEELDSFLLGVAPKPDRAPDLALTAEATSQALLNAIARLEDPVMPMVFVPQLASKFGATLLKAALLEAAAQRRVELRPESGVGLLSAEEAELCPRTSSGVVLSYVRRLGREEALA